VFEHAEDGCTASDVKNDLVLEQVSVLVDRVSVAPGANLIFLQRFRQSLIQSGVARLWQQLQDWSMRTSISSWMPVVAH
jgi:hypothetical protein